MKPSKLERFLFLFFLIYLLGAIILIKFYQYEINPDGVSYIKIAQEYATGDFLHAINKFWPPLYSWLLVPFLYLGVNPLLSTKILSAFLGLFTMFGLKSLSYKFNIDNGIRKILLLSSVPVIWTFAFSVISPDLLLTTFLVFYLDNMLSLNYALKIQNGLLVGLLGGLAHLTKSYGFFFFLSSFLLFSLILYLDALKNKKKFLQKQTLRNLFAGLLVFFAICVLWISVLSNHYKQSTFYVANQGNFMRLFWGPNDPNFFSFFERGLIPPPHESSLSVWEDPSSIKMVDWNPLDSWSEFRYQLYKIKINSIFLFLFLLSFSYLSLPIIAAFIYFYLKNFKKEMLIKHKIFPLIIIVLFLPYLLVYLDGRYFEFVFILIILMAGNIISKLQRYRRIILFLVVLSFLKNPVEYLTKNIDMGKDIYDRSQEIKALGKIEKGSKIASNDNYFDSLYLTFYLEGKYYGYPERNIKPLELIERLRERSIEYFIVWNEPSNKYPPSFKEITDKKIVGLTIYRLVAE